MATRRAPVVDAPSQQTDDAGERLDDITSIESEPMPTRAETERAVLEAIRAFNAIGALRDEIATMSAAQARQARELLSAMTGAVKTLESSLVSIRTDHDFILAMNDLPIGHKNWLASLAAQRGVPMGKVLETALNPMVTWDPNAFCTLITGDVAVKIRGIAAALSITPGERVVALMEHLDSIGEL